MFSLIIFSLELVLFVYFFQTKFAAIFANFNKTQCYTFTECINC